MASMTSVSRHLHPRPLQCAQTGSVETGAPPRSTARSFATASTIQSGLSSRWTGKATPNSRAKFVRKCRHITSRPFSDQTCPGSSSRYSFFYCIGPSRDTSVPVSAEAAISWRPCSQAIEFLCAYHTARCSTNLLVHGTYEWLPAGEPPLESAQSAWF
jgi:hypothetical protein